MYRVSVCNYRVLINSGQEKISLCSFNQTTNQWCSDNGTLKTIRLSRTCSLLQFVFFYTHLKCQTYRVLLVQTLENLLNKQVHLTSDLNVIPVKIVIYPIVTEWNDAIPVDIFWCSKIQRLARVRMEMEETLSWLSTLGGAFSSLGDQNLNFARKAGQISLSQLKMSCLYGDPNLTARCFIYISHSLCQQGHKRKAISFLKTCLFPYLVKLGSSCDRIVQQMYKALCFRIRFIYR